jgi:predicted CXXCH cytochrome family protein
VRARLARTFLLPLAACAAACGAGAARDPRPLTTTTHEPTHTATGVAKGAVRHGPARPGENVAFDDYAGSEACVPCHADLAARWRLSPMHRMTRESPAAEVRAPFAGETFSFKGDSVRLTSDGGERFFEIVQKGGQPRFFRMTRVIGGRVREDYAGIQVVGARKAAATVDGTEWVMPVTFVLGKKKLRYKGYSVMVKERPQLHEGPEWNKTCIFCHNTVPYVDTVLGAFTGKKTPYQGEVVDPLLPASRRFVYRVADAAAFRALVSDESARLGGEASHDTEPAHVAMAGVNAIRSHFGAASVVETGIGCESCHNGARLHAEHPAEKPRLTPTSRAFVIGPDGRTATRAETVNRVCARCHQVLFSGYPHTWEGGERHGTPGGSNINSGEARDMMLGHCQAELACTSCHDPHAADNATKSAALTDATCTQCHAGLRTREQAEAHSHHSQAGEGGRCISCHMPRKNLSLEGKLSRYHRIGSPNDPERVLLDRPLECALCHGDKTVRELTKTMTTWWKRPFDEGALTKLYGSVDANVLLATVERGKPHEIATAAYLLGDAKGVQRSEAFRVLGPALVNPYPMVRSYAQGAMEKLGGAPFPVDLDLDATEIDRARLDYLSSHAGASRPGE